MERALERRPGLARRLFTEAELDHAASRARPGQHLAARFCAKEAVTKALTLDVLRPLDIEVLSGAVGEPRVILAGVAALRAEELGVSVQVSLTHTRAMAGAVALAARIARARRPGDGRRSAAALVRAAARRRARARRRPLGDRGARDAVARADGARVAGPRRPRHGDRPAGTVAVVCGAGNNGGDGYAAARLLRGMGREVSVLAAVPAAELKGDARTRLDRLPGDGPAPFEPERARRARRSMVDALLGTGFSGELRGTVGEAVDGARGGARPGHRLRRAERRRRLHRRGRGARGAGARDRDVPRRQAGLRVNPGKAHAGLRARRRHRDPRARPRSSRRTAAC